MKFSGFLNVYRMDDMSWKYVLGEKSHTADNLKDMEFIVRMHGLKWGILDRDLAKKSVEDDRANFTGFLNVYRHDGFWCYRGCGLKAKSLQTLKKKVTKEGLEWKETDKELAYKNWKLDLRRFK